jgi:probable H4MPT-linked C1 transfer pathway protein
MLVRIWTIDARLVSEAAAREEPLRVAAANWLALAALAGRFCPSGSAVLIDVGSTTTDIIPLQDGIPVPRGRTDPERLRSGELIYTGVRRTPLCALLGSAGAAELFATTLDVYLTLEMIPEDASDRCTADGRPATRAAAHARLARMLCADAETCSPEETKGLARLGCQRQVQLIRRPLREMIQPQPPYPGVILAGAGEFLARMALEQEPVIATSRILSLSQHCGRPISEAACAFALARLAVEGFNSGE